MKNAFIANDHKPRWLISIPLRTFGAVLVMLAGFGCAVSIYMHAFTEDIYLTRKQGLQNIVSLAKNAIEPVLEERRAGKISFGDARIKATEVIDQFVYDNNGVSNYVFFASYEGYVLVEPAFPDTVGTYQMQRKDAVGTQITKLLLAKAKSGGGFVDYYESQAPGDNPRKKLTYIIGIPEINCYLGTGIYVDDIDNSINQLHQKLMLLGLIIIAGVLALQYYFMRPLIRYHYWLSEVVKNWGNDLDAVYSIQPPAHLKNLDIEQLLDSLKSMQDKIKHSRQNIEQNAEKFRQIAHATIDVMWEWDCESHTTVWSDNIEKMVGYAPKGENSHFEVLEEWVHPEDRKARRQALAVYFSGACESFTCEYRMYDRAKDEYHWVLARGIATFDKHRTPLRMVGSLIKIPVFVQIKDSEQNQDQEKIALTGLRRIGDIAQRTPCICGDMVVIDVKKRMDNEQWQGIAVVENNKPIGLVMRNELNSQLSGQYGVSLYYGRQVKLIMDEQPLVVDSDLSLEQVAEAARKRSETKLYDLIIVTENGDYYGTVSVMELLSCITDLRIQLAANASPLTGLPGNLVIEEKLKQALQHDFAALYIDLDNFKAFNDKYGFEMGDRALKLTVAILRDVAAATDEDNVFLGHIGGDDFIVLLYQPELARGLAARIIKEFDGRIPGLYLPEDLARGYITVPDRRGDKQRYPIISISIALIENRSHRFSNFLEVAEVAAQLKKKAKMIEGSIVVSDQRDAAI